MIKNLQNQIQNIAKSNMFRRVSLVLFMAGIVVFTLIFIPSHAQVEENQDCLMCHEDKSLTGERNGKTFSAYVDESQLIKSAHSGLKCIDCHNDEAFMDMPHGTVAKPTCGSIGCHPQAVELQAKSLHGLAEKRGDPLAPTCVFCHGSHNITMVKAPNSKVSPLQIPVLCGTCHREGTAVQLFRDIDQSRIIENYTESIHGEGLMKKGLVVTATCVSCHTAHSILPHTDQNSSIARKNIAQTCATCHAKIEDVHSQVIQGELWEKEKHVLPACVDCHQPHTIRRVFYDFGLADKECLKCHEKPDLKHSKTGKSMFIDTKLIYNSVHSRQTCVQCHTGVAPSHERPCDNITQKVDCASCHEAVNNNFMTSSHGMARFDDDKVAPDCKICHGTHQILNKNDINSQTFKTNLADLCTACHKDTEHKPSMMKGADSEILQFYQESIHGKGVSTGSLLVTANCADCHFPHKELPHTNPNASTHDDNIAETCGNCHFGIKNTFMTSIHSTQKGKVDKNLPTCKSCHKPHTVSATEGDDFRFSIMSTCGQCHQDLSLSYFDTYHGKVSKLGSARAAKCHDCHGAHNILSSDNPHSSLHSTNIVETCKSCHPAANRGFTGFLTHATHHEPDKYPILYGTFWGMTILLVSVFLISWIHTLLWLPRSLKYRRLVHKLKEENQSNVRIVRFTPLNRVLHIFMIISFLLLAITGMAVKFSYMGWANFVVKLMGGVETAGYLHRFGAVVLIAIFIIHVWDLIRMRKREYSSWKEMIFGKDSMMFNKKDWEDFVGSMKWFIGKGERPQYGRWTYWEKFDYFAVFWGIFVIGSTGLMLWFPAFFTYFLPGQFLNVATIIHSDEALLAAGFIFTIHFFNTHFRPEKFPMDTVVFTGSYDLEEFKLDRPEEYKKIEEAGELHKYVVDPPSKAYELFVRIFGWSALIIGLSVVTWIVYSIVYAMLK